MFTIDNRYFNPLPLPQICIKIFPVKMIVIHDQIITASTEQNSCTMITIQLQTE